MSSFPMTNIFQRGWLNHQPEQEDFANYERKKGTTGRVQFPKQRSESGPFEGVEASHELRSNARAKESNATAIGP